MNARRVASLFPAALLVASGAACFRYVPVETDASMERGTPIRVLLSRPADIRLTDLTANSAREVRGEMIEWRGDSLALSAYWVVTATEVEHRARGETVLLAGDGIARIERKEMDVARTAGLAVGVAAATAVAGVAVAGGGNEGGPPGGNGIPPQ